MSLQEQDEQAKEDAYFVSSSVAEALVPANHERSINELFEVEDHTGDEGSQSLLPWISQREVLFLDEDVNALVVLKTPLLEEEALKKFLQRTRITVELCATGIGPNAKPNDPRPQAVKDVLSETIVDNEEEPFIVASSLDGADEEPFLFVIWKVHLPLNRPHVKLQKLSAYLAPSVLLKPVEKSGLSEAKSELLPSMIPQPINLLQPFEFDPRFAGQRPYLSASRITKVAPAAPLPRDAVRRLRTAPKRIFRAGPALFWRIRFSKTTAPPKSNSMFATLELEVPQIWQCDVSVADITLQLAQGDVAYLGPNVPEVLKPGDQFTVLFKFTSPVPISNESDPVDQLDIAITASAKVSETCAASLSIKWTTPADFAFDEKLRTEDGRTSMEQQRAPGPDSLPYPKDGNLEKPVVPSGPSGITVTVTGPDSIVVGKPFKWEIFVVNRSNVVQHLAVFPISKPSPSQERRHFPPAITPLRPANAPGRDERVGSGNDVYEMPISWFFEPSELTCLSSSARVAPLPASACGTTELKFVAAAPGMLHVEALRVVDLATRAIWDITDLPDIVAALDNTST